MAIISYFLKGPATQNLKLLGGHKGVAENFLKFADNNVSASDVVEAIQIPKNAIVTHVRIEVITAEGGVVTLDVGDAVDPNGWVAAADGNAAAGVIVGAGALATNGKRYTDVDTIDIIPSADLDTVEIYIQAEFVCVDIPLS